MQLELLPMSFAVLRLDADAPMPQDLPYTFWSRTDAEVSLVCPEVHIPTSFQSIEKGWRAFRVAGTLDFSLIGILSRLTTALAAAEVGVFVLSTFLTDYILVREGHLQQARQALLADGHEIAKLP